MSSDPTPTPAQDPRLGALARLVGVIDRLRAPDGCPWDRAQTLETMAPHVLEEAYEVVDALRGDDDPTTLGELGDLLMNVLLLARIAEDGGRFSIEDVAQAVTDKLIRRHPHVFGDERAGDATEALARWQAIKREERAARGDPDGSALAGVPRELPALLRASRIGEKAAQVGFDWPDRTGPLAKIEEELSELATEIEGGRRDRMQDELGDVLFSLVNLARHLGVDPETALRAATDRFSARFRRVEASLGPRLGEASLAELEAAWNDAK